MMSEARLRESGFVENPKRGLWFNRKRRTAFSDQAIRDMDPSWLEHHLAEQLAPEDFVFHFNRPPRNLQICREILKELGLSNLHAHVRLATFGGRNIAYDFARNQ